MEMTLSRKEPTIGAAGPETGRSDESALRAEHRQICALLDRIDDLLGAGAFRVASLRAALRELAAVLREHFARETETPLVREAPARFFRFQHVLERLSREHAEILARLDVIQRTPTTLETMGQARLLTGAIRAHEAEEEDVLQRAYCEDLGAGD